MEVRAKPRSLDPAYDASAYVLVEYNNQEPPSRFIIIRGHSFLNPSITLAASRWFAYSSVED